MPHHSVTVAFVAASPETARYGGTVRLVYWLSRLTVLVLQCRL
ncbi:hypothetical protein [Limisphaera sp. VF-2]